MPIMSSRAFISPLLLGRGLRVAIIDGARSAVLNVSDIGIGGADLAASFMKLDLIDEYQPVIHPVVVGGGTPFFPPLDARIELKLEETRTFGSGAVYLRYSAGRPG
jgi:dihydrofolate reductase